MMRKHNAVRNAYRVGTVKPVGGRRGAGMKWIQFASALDGTVNEPMLCHKYA